MSLTAEIARHFREMHVGPSFAGPTFKEKLADLTWEQANTRIGSLNTIAILVYHVNYYVAGVIQVFEGGPLEIRDKYSFDMPPMNSQEEWEALHAKFFRDAERFAELVEQMPEEQLKADFIDGKYGKYFRNLFGMVEHSYYHLGQVTLLRKMVLEE